MSSEPGGANGPRRLRLRPALTFWRTVFLTLGLALLVYLLARLGFRQLLAMLFELRLAVVPVFLLYAAHQLLRAYALTFCAPGPGRLPLSDALAIRLSGEAVQYLTFSGPVLAEPTKAWLLQRRGLTTWQGLSATLAEYLSSTVAAATYAIVGFSYILIVLGPVGPIRLGSFVVLVSLSAVVVAFVVGIVGRVHIIGSVVRAVTRLPAVRNRVRDRTSGLREAEDLLIQTLRHPRKVVPVFAIEAAAQLCLGLELFAMLAALEPQFELGRAMVVEGVTKFITFAYFFVPGQLGVAEGTYALLFRLFAIPAAAGVVVAFVRRLRSVATAAVGLAMLSLITRPGRPVAEDLAADRRG